jgi:Fungal specific transcription factor domain
MFERSIFNTCSFSAALLGLPKLLKEEDIHAEYPSDTDDEYVTEKGFQPTLPGESTKISSALALFRASRILSKVLDQNYPAAATHDLSLQSLTSLETELNEWSDSLPVHLKLTFVQDKPSTDVTGSRSALLVSFDILQADCKFAHLDIVSCILLHTHSHPPACCWLHSW